jgi:hypothetical protein
MVIAVVGVFATFSAWFYTQYFLLRPIGTGPAGPILDKNVFATEWSQSAVSLVGLGDSITAGLGAASTDHTFFRGYDAIRRVFLKEIAEHTTLN